MTSVLPSRTIDSPARSRTRRAIVLAAAAVLAADRTAPLARVAEAAEVGRSTLHRYFPDREELVRAVAADSFQVLAESVHRAALDQGPPAGALRRLVAALVESGDRLRFLTAVRGMPDAPPAVSDLIARGQAERALDRRPAPGWIWRTVWALAHAGCEEVAAGRADRHAATDLAIYTLEHGIIGAPGGAAPDDRPVGSG